MLYVICSTPSQKEKKGKISGGGSQPFNVASIVSF